METPLSTDAPSAVETLTLQRTRIQDWLARLSDVGSEVPPHVTERVRRDYEDRLRDVTRQLAEHRDALSAELDDRRGELEDADALRAAAQDDLQEARLRHMIGEVEEGDWDERRPRLESALADAEADAARVRGEVERLESLLRDVGDGDEPPAPAPAPAVEAQPELESEPVAEPAFAELPPRDSSDDTIPEFMPYSGSFGPGDAAAGDADDDLGVDLSWLEDVEQAAPAEPSAGSPAAPADVSAETSADDLAFLAELDRAISHSTTSDGSASPSVGGTDDRTLDPDRAGMLLCKECGAINEPQLWYCEICGSEL
jgi:hypothetical protein